MNNISPMQLKEYNIREFSVKANEKYVESEGEDHLEPYKIEVIPTFQSHKKEQFLHRIILDTTIRKKNNCFKWNSIRFKVMGFFEFEGEIEEDKLERLLIYNGTSILYSTMRAHVFNLTSSPNF